MKRSELRTWAKSGLRAEIQRHQSDIETLQAQLALLEHGSATSAPTPHRRRRKMSAAGRKRISDMMKARWAAKKKEHAKR